MTSNYQDYLSWTYFSEDALDRAEFRRFADLLRGVTHFIDVGASHGVYTFHASRILEDADILCIEADPERFKILEQNTRTWAAESSNRIRCVNAAASDELDRKASPEITFFTTGTQISGGLFSVVERSGGYQPCQVPVVCLDDFYVEGASTFIKIDVEGGELRVLKGARRHLDSGRARFFTEISWWGDRPRRTTSFDVLRFVSASKMRVDRRLRSDYLFSPEPSRWKRVLSVARCVPPLLIRYIWNTVVPQPIRVWRERRNNQRRLARYGKPVGTGRESA